MNYDALGVIGNNVPVGEFDDQVHPNERRFRQLIDSLPAAIYTTDAEGRITHFNQACVAFSGRIPEIGSDQWCVTWKLFHPDGRRMPHCECPMAVALKERRIIRGAEAIAERPDGTRIWFEPFPTLLFDEAGELIGGVNMLVDITQRKAAENDSAKLAAIVAGSDDAIISKNLDGIIMSWNDAAQRMFGYTADEAVGTMITRLIPEDRMAEEREILLRLRRGERISHYETQRRCKSGKLLDVSLSLSPIKDRHGHIVGASNISRDITQRKQLEHGLFRRAAQQQTVARIGEFALMHSMQDTFDYATAAVAETLSVEYCKVLELLPGGDAVLLRSGVGWKPGLVGCATVDTGLNSQAGYTLKSDAPVVVSDLRTEKRFNGPPLLIEHGVISGMSCIIRQPGGAAWGVLGTHCKRRVDFTQDDVNFLVAVANVLGTAVERDLAEQKLQAALAHRTDEVVRSQRELALSQRMAAVGTLAAGLAHDMGNLLLPLGAQVDVLLNRERVEPDVAEHLGVISTMLNHLRDLARNLSLFSRDPDRDGDVGHTDIAQWHAAIHKLLNASLGRDIAVKWECPDNLPGVAVAPHRLTQIVQNLLHNARDAVLAAKALGLITKPAIAVNVRSDDDHRALVLSVVDNGVGMDAEIKRRCLEPFFTTRSRSSTPGAGSGLGLSLAHQIVERAGGSLTIDSKPGHGTSIAIRLPCGAAAQ